MSSQHYQASKQFSEFVEDRILQPLRMSQSTYSIDKAVQSGNVSETWTPFGRRIPPWMEGLETELVAGPGGLISNVKDIASGTPIELSGTIIGYGLGWFRFSVAGHDSLYHNGGAPGVSADITIAVLDGVGVANADRKQPALHDITVAILRKSALAS
ncbi:hypothetical protein EDB86DRAFT_1637507 [Lactarius hatsudake]|nr:hypothetical protein EDB86DRAFT_1637507 [Lactarius hatsudake]